MGENMRESSLKRNIVMNALLTISSLIFPIITFPYVSRILSPIGIGKVSFAISFISYFSLFAQLGIPTYGIRVCAKIRDDKEKLTRTAQELLIINLIMDCISYFVLFLLLRFVPKLQEEKTLYVLVSATILLTSIGMEWLYKALEQYTYITIRSVIFKFIALIGMFLLIHNKEDYIVYGILSIFASSASNIFNFVNAHKYISLKPVGKYEFRRHLKPILIFFSMSCATTIYGNLDSVMLGFIKNDIDVGYYGTAVKIKNVLIGIVTSLGSVLLPRSSFFVEHGRIDEFHWITKKAFRFVCIIAIPLMVYFMIFAKESIITLSGTEYFDSIVPMIVVMPTLLLIGLSNIIGLQILVPLGKEKVVLYSEIGGAITNIIFNSILIPLFAATGAAIGTVLAEFVVLSIQCIYLNNEFKNLIKDINFIQIFVAIVVAILCSVWVKILNLQYIIALIISATLFFGSYGIYMLIQKETIVVEIYNMIIRKIFRKKN